MTCKVVSMLVINCSEFYPHSMVCNILPTPNNKKTKSLWHISECMR